MRENVQETKGIQRDEEELGIPRVVSGAGGEGLSSQWE